MRLTRRLLLASPALLPLVAAAQDYPTKPVTLVISYPPGGIVDTVGRRMAERLGGLLGKPVVVENRGGAGGNIAASAVAKAPPDGHTLLFCTYATLSIAAAAGTRLDFDPLRSLTAVAPVGPLTVLLVVRNDFPAQSIEEFVAYARANPGRVNFGSIGVGSSYHLALEQLKALSGTDIAHVPYRGGAAAMTDLLGGRLDAMLGTWSMTRPHLQNGGFRALALANEQRASVTPNLPTVAEHAVPGARLVDGLGIFAPAATPAPVVARLNAAVREILAEPGMAAWLTEQGTPPTPLSAAAFTAMMQQDAAMLGSLIRHYNISVE